MYCFRKSVLLIALFGWASVADAQPAWLSDALPSWRKADDSLRAIEIRTTTETESSSTPIGALNKGTGERDVTQPRVSKTQVTTVERFANGECSRELTASKDRGSSRPKSMSRSWEYWNGDHGYILSDDKAHVIVYGLTNENGLSQRPLPASTGRAVISEATGFITPYELISLARRKNWSVTDLGEKHIGAVRTVGLGVSLPGEKCSLWCNPDQGYVILSILREFDRNSLASGLTTSRQTDERGRLETKVEQSTDTTSITSVSNRDGVWLPESVQSTLRVRYADGRSYSSSATTKLDYVKSVTVQDVRDIKKQFPVQCDATVYGQADGVPHQWRDGEVLLYSDPAIAKSLDRTAAVLENKKISTGRSALSVAVEICAVGLFAIGCLLGARFMKRHSNRASRKV